MQHDMWGDDTPITMPCAKHAELINRLQTVQAAARDLRENLCALDEWAQEICRLTSVYDVDDLVSYRAIVAQCSETLDAAMAPPTANKQ